MLTPTKHTSSENEKNITNSSNNTIRGNNIDDVELCYEVIKEYIGNEIPKNRLIDIISNTISFEIPVKEIENSIYSLELFHGPTLAFKDVGAKFMALCLDYFKENNSSKKMTVLVATSGDTGGAVANGF